MLRKRNQELGVRNNMPFHPGQHKTKQPAKSVAKRRVAGAAVGSAVAGKALAEKNKKMAAAKRRAASARRGR